jgi:hypothetical protein
LFSALEILAVVLLLLFVFRGGLASGEPIWRPGKGFVKDDSIRLIMFAILILLLIGFIVRAVMPLGEYG